ncbi:MAG: sulfite exporter TauE/SafE family protein [Microthrixaceae bacterium]
MERLLVFVLAGFVAQLIDGSLGMGFGVIGTSVLVAAGASAAVASAVIHAAKVGTALVSGASHWRFGNVHWRTVLLIGVPGAAGAYVGATILSNVDGERFAPVTASILLVLGGYMLARFAFGMTRRPADPSHLTPQFLVPLGVVGGVVDALGGGGWGPVTTPTLMTAGRMEPRTAIGSVSFSELLVALAASIGFLTHLDSQEIEWGAVAALLLGAVIVAPFAAWVVKVMAPRVLGTFVGGLIVVLNARTILLAADAPGAVVAAVLSLLGLISVALVWRSWEVAREEAALQALVPHDVDGTEPGHQPRSIHS